MDFYVIPPLAHLDLMHQGKGNRYFCLAQLYKKSPEYREFFRERVREGAWVTLDNGAGDHDVVTEEDLFTAMEDLLPSEVIPPDYLFDCDRTMSAFALFVTQMRMRLEFDKIEIFACPQGATRDEWVECYTHFLNIPQVNTIGMSKIAVPKAFLDKTGDTDIAEARNIAYDYLKTRGLLHKPLHFLGMGDPREFRHYKGDPIIRSTDSCNTVWAGMNDIKFPGGDFRRIPTPKDYFDRTMSSYERMVAQLNIDWFKAELDANAI